MLRTVVCKKHGKYFVFLRNIAQDFVELLTGTTNICQISRDKDIKQFYFLVTKERKKTSIISLTFIRYHCNISSLFGNVLIAYKIKTQGIKSKEVTLTYCF